MSRFFVRATQAVALLAAVAWLVLVVYDSACGVDNGVRLTRNASAHDIPPENTAFPDSVRVHFEEDPDGDGFYQIQYTYNDRAGVWGVPGTGRARVMYEVAPDTMTTVTYLLFINSTATPLPDSAAVGLIQFSAFGMAFATPLKQFEDGTLTFASPGWQWYMVPEIPDSTVVEP